MADVTEVGELLHGKETSVYADADYTGAEQHASPQRGRTWFVAAKRSKVKAIEDAEVRYRGLVKNRAQVMTLFALANLWMARKPILAGTG